MWVLAPSAGNDCATLSDSDDSLRFFFYYVYRPLESTENGSAESIPAEEKADVTLVPATIPGNATS